MENSRPVSLRERRVDRKRHSRIEQSRTLLLYEVGAIVAGAAAPMLSRRLGVKRLLGFAALVYGAFSP
jgi:hypothetical protein